MIISFMYEMKNIEHEITIQVMFYCGMSAVILPEWLGITSYILHKRYEKITYHTFSITRKDIKNVIKELRIKRLKGIAHIYDMANSFLKDTDQDTINYKCKKYNCHIVTINSYLDQYDYA